MQPQNQSSTIPTHPQTAPPLNSAFDPKDHTYTCADGTFFDFDDLQVTAVHEASFKGHVVRHTGSKGTDVLGDTRRDRLTVLLENGLGRLERLLKSWNVKGKIITTADKIIADLYHEMCFVQAAFNQSVDEPPVFTTSRNLTGILEFFPEFDARHGNSRQPIIPRPMVFRVGKEYYALTEINLNHPLTKNEFDQIVAQNPSTKFDRIMVSIQRETQ